jgi:dihydrofolate reductase
LIISFIVAMDENQGIGKENRLPWHLGSDLKRFRELTMGHFILMGRKTWESIGRPLVGRTSIVITKNHQFLAENCIIVHSIQEGIDYAEVSGEMELFIVGGAKVFKQALPLADRLYLTQIHAIVSTDVHFPKLNLSLWEEIDRVDHPSDDINQYPFTFITLKKTGTDLLIQT